MLLLQVQYYIGCWSTNLSEICVVYPSKVHCSILVISWWCIFWCLSSDTEFCVTSLLRKCHGLTSSNAARSEMCLTITTILTLLWLCFPLQCLFACTRLPQVIQMHTGYFPPYANIDFWFRSITRNNEKIFVRDNSNIKPWTWLRYCWFLFIQTYTNIWS